MDTRLSRRRLLQAGAAGAAGAALLPAVGCSSDDAGAALRFFDVYRRMVGGELQLQVSMADGPQIGSVAVDGFALRADSE